MPHLHTFIADVDAHRQEPLRRRYMGINMPSLFMRYRHETAIYYSAITL